MCGHILRRFSESRLGERRSACCDRGDHTWYLTDRMSALYGTEYGSLVQIKIGLFLGMLCFAALDPRG